MFGLFKKGDPIDDFWKWFAENEKTFHNFQNNPNKYLNELLVKSKKIEDGLVIELEPLKEGYLTMTVSADGIIDLFPLVQQIVDKAPPINGWKICAFRQRMPAEKVKQLVLTVQNLELTLCNMRFSPVVTDGSLDIVIYVAGITEENQNQVAYGGLMLVDNILGEYDCATKVRNYYFYNMPPDADTIPELLPLLKLAEYIDNSQKAEPSKIAICAFNSAEMNDEELIKDDLQLFVKWELSNMFCDLMLRRDLVFEMAELDQIGQITGINVEPLYDMTFYWDKTAEAEHLSYCATESDKAKQLAIIQTSNEKLIHNIDRVHETVISLENALNAIENLEEQIVDSNDGFFNDLRYFAKTNDGYSDTIYSDIKKMSEFLVFVKSLDGDTTYFKFKPGVS
ncbi:MAG: hypothetical protein A3D31_04730 [Candidatus Fluviicola riflensis]|nr:MAG: hypothetical protein CHH17_10290 [Candidatus Fluviicola riflensis]OGS79281.1 MAG: hypothetical protein A3D31_04730 [Candidatus Fluviicola riflensis]OGS86713.1 MAG: hypothetical protein A2724_04190 [Fluviicola sp. RIFCSPHIGHO2_01_FULL_43_53]OGS88813.1 MAG: hypothetical protein A3E30_00470 [Fluviicola sp. RIFCSPHIGHO2_12_FULL_43_24]